MAEKLYKNKYTIEDLKLIQAYVAKHGESLFVEIWQNDNEDGDVFDIKPQNLVHAIEITNKYYDNVNANKKVAELIVREKNGEYTTIYHTERNRSGITYEVLRYAKA